MFQLFFIITLLAGPVLEIKHEGEFEGLAACEEHAKEDEPLVAFLLMSQGVPPDAYTFKVDCRPIEKGA